MFRLLSLAAFSALLLLVICGAGPHRAQSHAAHLDRLELPPAVATSTALESASDLNATVAAMVPVTRCTNTERLHADLPESISLRDPLTASSILRV